LRTQFEIGHPYSSQQVFACQRSCRRLRQGGTCLAVDRRACFDTLTETTKAKTHLRSYQLFRLRDAIDPNAVEKPCRCGEQHGDLLDHRQEIVLALPEDLADPAAALQLSARVLVETAAKTREGFQVLELRVGELQVSDDCPVGGQLCITTDPRNRDADVDSGQLARTKQMERDIDLTVRDRNEISRNKVRQVLGLCLDDR
jgi:hypothetical protein